MRATFLVTALSVLVILLLGINALFIFKYFKLTPALFTPSSITIQTEDQSGKTTKFLQLFVDKVLQTAGEVNFEDRLKLENAVRELDNQTALEKWQAFVNSATNDEAQKNVRDLLKILVDSLNE